MDKKEVIRILKTEKQYVCSAPGTYMLAQGPMLGFTRTNKYFREYYHYEIVIYKKKFICQCESWNQAYKNNKQLYDDPKTAKKKVIGWARLREEFLEMCSKLPNPAEISELDNRKLESSFFAYLERLNEVMAAPLVTDGIGVYTETDLWEDFLREENRKDARKIFLELTHSPTLSFAGQEKLGFLNLLLLYKKNRRNSSQFETKLAEHQRRFFWINNDYTQVRVLDRKYFLDRKDRMRRQTPWIQTTLSYFALTAGRLSITRIGCLKRSG
ncbi:MAG: hypothetical protein NT001_07140 [Candidatus Woesearchaeota archaeon]|nr:hypothetical protein [Candidatus Woesearchaeota archaeon]